MTDSNILKAANDTLRRAKKAEARVAELKSEIRRKTAAEIIESLMPVGPLTNKIPSHYLALVEEYITEQFGVTDSDIEEIFQIEYDRRNARQQILDNLRALEVRAEAAEARVAELEGRVRELLGQAAELEGYRDLITYGLGGAER
jgi:hypothetical protein